MSKAMQQYLVLTALGQNLPGAVVQLGRVTRDCGCNIVDSRMAAMGSEVAAIMMVSGPWDSIAKIEDQLPKLQQDLGMALHWKRTESGANDTSEMPYAIDVVGCDRAGVVFDIAKFIADNELHIQDLHSNTYQAARTGTQMFSLHMTVSIPVSMSISALRNDFMDFCDRLNLDAIMEPVK
jgi:glycine cleavage system transcriptional repressor